MAKKSSIEKNKRRIRLAEQDLTKRLDLKKLIMNKETPIDDRFQAQLKLSKMRRNGARSRIRNRCSITGRPKGFYRKFGLGRNKLREQAMEGNIPGLHKASW